LADFAHWARALQIDNDGRHLRPLRRLRRPKAPTREAEKYSRSRRNVAPVHAACPFSANRRIKA